MKNTVITCSSNRGIDPLTRDCLGLLQQAGARFLYQKGSADVAFARNQAFTAACQVLKDNPECDVVLNVDDDMTFTVEQAELVVKVARQTGRAASGVYGTADGHVAGARVLDAEGKNSKLWRVGLGFFAVPKKQLLELAEKSESYRYGDAEEHVAKEFCWTEAVNGEWVAEDFCLCNRLGGVLMVPIAIGHVKKVELFPDDATIEAIATGADLPAHPPR